MRGASLLKAALSWSLALSALLGPAAVRADGSFPDPLQVLLPPARPDQIILVTNFGLIFSEDAGKSWQFSCEQSLTAYAGPYLLGAPPSSRIYAIASGSGLIYSDDDSCSWNAAQGSLTNVLPYALSVDPSDSKHVYVIGVPRDDLHGGESIYASHDGGLTFGEPIFTAPERSALLTVLAAPSQPSTLYATLFTTPENHPTLLRSDDRGQNWQTVANLVDSLGANPFELIAIDAENPDKLFARVLGATAEALAISDDGGLSFDSRVEIRGKLKAFVELASGTMLVGGTAGTEAIAYRSSDGGLSFDVWQDPPHVHAMAERDGTLYIAADNFLDGYAIGVSDDEGLSVRPLTGFKEVSAVKSCVTQVCAESCAYYADIELWPEMVCGSEVDPEPPGAVDGGSGGDASGAGSGIGAAPAGGNGGHGVAPGDDEPRDRSERRARGGGCACQLASGLPADAWAGLGAMGWGALLLAGRRRILTRVRSS
jgi:hypothetical protein